MSIVLDYGRFGAFFTKTIEAGVGVQRVLGTKERLLKSSSSLY